MRSWCKLKILFFNSTMSRWLFIAIITTHRTWHQYLQTTKIMNVKQGQNPALIQNCGPECLFSTVTFPLIWTYELAVLAFQVTSMHFRFLVILYTKKQITILHPISTARNFNCLAIYRPKNVNPGPASVDCTLRDLRSDTSLLPKGLQK